MAWKRRAVAAFAVLVCLAWSPVAAWAAGPVVISQVYGGGGNSGTVYTNDFIELFNRSGAPVDLTGMSVQYASASSASWALTALPSFTLQPGQFFLVEAHQGAGGTTPLPTPDASGTLNLATQDGKIALVSNATALSAACPSLPDPTILDFVGYGNASCFETAATPRPSSNSTQSVIRTPACADTDDNSVDFVTAAAAPRNSASPFDTCNLCANVTCTPADACHDAACNIADGSCISNAKADGASCDDGQPCTSGDVCTLGICAGTQITCLPLDTCHLAGVCDATSGVCSDPPAVDGITCDDADGCTTGDTCQAGTCTGAAVTCTASDECHDVGTCSNGTCSNPAAADGTACSVGTCEGGTCTVPTGAGGSGGSGGSGAGGSGSGVGGSGGLGGGETSTTGVGVGGSGGITGPGPATTTGSGDASSTSTSQFTSGAGGASSGDTAGGDSGGCGCKLASTDSAPSGLGLLGLLAVAMLARRRRQEAA